jgi:putative transposase
MNRKIVFSTDEYYHVYNRGVEMRDVFLANSDRIRFQELMFLCNSEKPIVHRAAKEIQGSTLYQVDRGESLVSIGAYCLMPNHFHILVKEITEGGLVKFMQKLTTGYTMYFNKKQKRVGPLFQGRFKAEHVGRDEYLKYLFAYIHLNPVKLIEPDWKNVGIEDSVAAQQYLKEYDHSSYLDYLGTPREEQLILSRKDFPEYFDKPHEFNDFINDWLEFRIEEGIIRHQG